MPTTLSLAELRNMTPSDLEKEAHEQKMIVVRLRLGMSVGKEKDTARYRREKKHLARILGVLSEKESLKSSSGRRKVHSSSRS